MSDVIFSVIPYILLAIPVAFLVASVYYSYKSVALKKRTRKAALVRQIASFAMVGTACLIGSMVVMAADPAEAAKAAGSGDLNKGISMVAAALATGISGIGGGIAVGGAAPAAIGATSEDPKAFGKALIFVALGEGVALYGLLVSILIISNAG